MMPTKTSGIRQTHAASSKAQGFSLLELLVVLAVIGILAALLLPVMSSARESAAGAKCLAQLRQMQAANATWAAERNGRYVPAWNNYEDDYYASNLGWYAFPPFIKALSPTNAFWPPWPDDLLCPSAARYAPANKRKIERCYGYNLTDTGSPKRIDTNWSGPPGSDNAIMAALVTEPSKTIAFADSVDWLINANDADKYTIEPMPSSPGKAVAYRHKGKANAVFFDGHAESLSRTQLVGGESRLKYWEIYR